MEMYKALKNQTVTSRADP